MTAPCSWRHRDQLSTGSFQHDLPLITSVSGFATAVGVCLMPADYLAPATLHSMSQHWIQVRSTPSALCLLPSGPTYLLEAAFRPSSGVCMRRWLRLQPFASA